MNKVRREYPISKPPGPNTSAPSEVILWPFPACAYCGGRVIFGQYVTELALKCEDCPCRMVVRNDPSQKARLFKAWSMRIGERPKVRVRKPAAARGEGRAGMSGWISTADRMPPERTYVLARHTRGTWFDSDDQENVNCVVVKLVRGISEAQRQRMKAGQEPDPPYNGATRSRFYCSEDEHANNRVPFCWKEFGPDSFFGQDISHWMPILPAAGPVERVSAEPEQSQSLTPQRKDQG